MSEEHLEKRRRRRSQAEIELLVVEFESSGTDREEFCQRHGLALSTRARYRRRLRAAPGDAGSSGRWLAVELTGPGAAGGNGLGSGLAVVLSRGRRIEVGIGFDAATLGHLLRLLEPA